MQELCYAPEHRLKKNNLWTLLRGWRLCPPGASCAFWGADADHAFFWCSLMSGLATMDSRACGKMGVITITYYLWTTFMAVTIGIILVVSIHPGAAAQKEDYSVGKVVLSSADALLDLIRYVAGFRGEPGAYRLGRCSTSQIFPQGCEFPGDTEI